MSIGVFGEHFPYSNYHNLNMDWIIKVIKDFLEQYNEIQTLIDNGKADITALTETELAELQATAEELTGLLNQWYQTHSEDIANELALAVTSFGNQADIKTAQCIASIPSDYSTLSAQVSALGEELRHIVIEDATLPTNTSATATAVELDMSRPNYVTITNNSGSDGYFRPCIFMGDTNKQSFSNQLIHAGESYTWKLFGISTEYNYFVWDWLNGNPYTNYTFYLGFQNTNARAGTYTLYNYDSDDPLKNGVITVGNYEDHGVMRDIISAIAYAKSKVDVAVNPVTIFVKNGKYTLRNTANRAVVDKGANRINIIGESKENVIFTLSNEYPNNNQMFNIGGPCIIKNLSLYNLSPGDTPPTITNNPYCLHNDTLFTTSEKYATVIEDCVFYSEMYNPIGAGLRNKQKQIYRRVTTVYANSSQTGGQGSLYVHSQGDSNETPAGLEIIDCCMVSQNMTECVTLPSVHTGDYQNIPVRFLKNTGWTPAQYPHYLSPVNFNFSPDSDTDGFEGGVNYIYNLP